MDVPAKSRKHVEMSQNSEHLTLYITADITTHIYRGAWHVRSRTYHQESYGKDNLVKVWD